MEFEKIKQLINDVSDSKLTSVEIELPDGTKINMKKDVKQETVLVNSFSEVQNSSTAMPISSSIGNNLNDVKEQDIKEIKEERNIVKSPMVGTFYSKPSPTSESYVKEGKEVKKGDTLCIIEAMKLMNEIESEFAGKVIEVLVKDGTMVEYGTPLFKIAVNE